MDDILYNKYLAFKQAGDINIKKLESRTLANSIASALKNNNELIDALKNNNLVKADKILKKETLKLVKEQDIETNKVISFSAIVFIINIISIVAGFFAGKLCLDVLKDVKFKEVAGAISAGVTYATLSAFLKKILQKVFYNHMNEASYIRAQLVSGVMSFFIKPGTSVSGSLTAQEKVLEETAKDLGSKKLAAKHAMANTIALLAGTIFDAVVGAAGFYFGYEKADKVIDDITKWWGKSKQDKEAKEKAINDLKESAIWQRANEKERIRLLKNLKARIEDEKKN